MHILNPSARLQELLADHRPPCVSIYIAIQRLKPPSQENRILLRNLLDEARDLMHQRYAPDQIAPVHEKLSSLAAGSILRNHGSHGLAVFASPDYYRLVDLPPAVRPSVDVADRFHIKPLVRLLHHGARFQVLCLSLNNVRVLEGNRYQLRDLPLRGVPRNIGQTLRGLRGDFPREPYGQTVMKHGQPPTDKDNLGPEPFFRAVDRTIWEDNSRDRKLPMIVCADLSHLSDFLALAENPYILDRGIAHNPDHLGNDRLLAEAWKIIAPRYQEELERLKDQFRTARAHRKGSDQLMQVAEAAAAGRVGTLLIDEHKQIPGILHRASGQIESAAARTDARAADVLDDLAELVLQKDGQVYVIPHEQMPTDAGVAALFRY